MDNHYKDLIIVISNKHLLNPNLVSAIVEIESSFNTDAIRYEPKYPYLLSPDVFAVKHRITVQTEECLQKFSWGLMQIMGAVAREHGYDGPLHRLCRPELSLEFGCLHFAKYLRRYNDIKKAISAYNGGPGAIKEDGFKNEKYVNKVMNRYVEG